MIVLKHVARIQTQGFIRDKQGQKVRGGPVLRKVARCLAFNSERRRTLIERGDLTQNQLRTSLYVRNGKIDVGDRIEVEDNKRTVLYPNLRATMVMPRGQYDEVWTETMQGTD